MKITYIKSFKNKKEKKETKIGSGLMKTVFKKNQIALFAIALMLITSGYLNYTNNVKMQIASLGDAKLVSTNTIEEYVDNYIKEADVNETINEIEENILSSTQNIEEVKNNEKVDETNEIIETSTNQSEYFTKTKLDRDTMYSQMIETYQKILENGSVPNEQKTTASEEIKNINNRKNAILTIENLIKAKGISDLAVLINEETVDAIIKSENNLEEDQIAQISNIISRELKTDIENIHITTHK